MANISDKAVYEILLTYGIDESKLKSSLKKTEAHIQASMDKNFRLQKRQRDRVTQMALTESRKTTSRVEAIEMASEKRKSSTRRKFIQSDWNNRLQRNAANLKREEAQERASADKKKGFLSGFSNFGGKLGTISSYGAAIAVINAVRQAITYAITKMIEFEVAFTDLAVKSGYTNKEMVKVSKTITDVASATKFSTLEIVESATALGKLGFEANEVSQILPNLANVAAATGESLQATAEILGKVINAYEYTAEQSGIISDRMVDIFNNSALNLEKFNTAFSYVGSAAASTGTSFDELTAAMAILSDRGITASKIGTGLRNVFTKLGTEGDSLRDILQRISEAHLSFYEVAELVGRRAANQLFIMADSLDEFDANVARSMDDYGEALLAAAKQQDTFKAKWDIFVNTVTNQVARPKFDPDEDFRTAIAESIGFMDLWNALWSDDNAVASINRLLTLYPKFAEEFKKMDDAMGYGNNDDSVVQAMMDETLDKIDKERKFFGKQTDEFNKLMKYYEALKGIKVLSGDSNIVDTLFEKEENKAKNIQQKLLIEWENGIDLAVNKFKGSLGASASDAFIQNFVIDFDEAKSRESLEKLYGTSKEGLEKIEKLFDGRKFLSDIQKDTVTGKEQTIEDKLKGIYKNIGSKGLLATLTELYNKDVESISTLTSGSDDIVANMNERDEKNVDDRIAHRNMLAKKICRIDPIYALKELGIECPAKSAKERGEFSQFERNVKDEQEYRVAKDRLNKEYNIEEDPIKKLQINNELINLEANYRASLNNEYKEYLDKMGADRDAFVAKYPDQAKTYDDNIVSVERSQIKDDATGQVNANTYLLRDLEDKKEAYKQDVALKNAYALEMSALDLKLKGTDRKNKKERAKIIEDKNKATDKYYDTEIERLREHHKTLTKELNNYNKLNTLFTILGLPTIDVTNLEKLITELAQNENKLNTDRNKAKETGNKFDTEDFDYFGAAMDMTENVYDVYRQFGDRKLELLKEQTARELEVIGERFDSENMLLQSALASGIISQEQATEAEERLRKKKIDAENKANKKLFEAQKKRDKEEAIFTGLSSTAQAIANAFAKNLPPVAVVMAAISAAAIASSTAMNIKAISSRKFIPQKYTDGGLIKGRSHSQGGVPFTVNGRSGFEAEGGEFIVNKRATAENIDELMRINGKTQTSRRKFATGGVVEIDDNSSNISELILEALSKPVRAYVTDQDLEKSQSERDALTRKTSF